jgi:hypothetical protein
MKNFLLLLITIAFQQLSQAQTEFVLRFDHRLDGKKYALNQEATSPLGTKYKLTRLQYYISGIKITHDAGQELNLNNMYLFVDPSKTTSKEFSLGTLTNVTTVEKIEFAVGVDAASNHLDPASYPASHPLAPKNPTMHWGWTSGYRFIALEGKAARSNGLFLDDVAIHTVDDRNFKLNSYNVIAAPENGKMYIDMIAEYNMLLDGITIAGGVNNHSESGSAADLCDNASHKVFSPASPTSTNNAYNNNLSEVIYTSNQVYVKYSIPSNSNVDFRLFDSNGKVIQQSTLNTTEGLLNIDNQIMAGNYFYSFSREHQIISTGKLVKR